MYVEGVDSLFFWITVLTKLFCSAQQNLSALKNLKILSIQSNRLTVIEGLDELESLEEIYLSHNGIEKIQGLEHNVSPRAREKKRGEVLTVPVSLTLSAFPAMISRPV